MTPIELEEENRVLRGEVARLRAELRSLLKTPPFTLEIIMGLNNRRIKKLISLEELSRTRESPAEIAGLTAARMYAEMTFEEPSEPPKGCLRSHPHEDMQEECQRMAIDAQKESAR